MGVLVHVYNIAVGHKWPLITVVTLSAIGLCWLMICNLQALDLCE